MRVIMIDVITPAAGLPVTAEEFVDHARLNGLTVTVQPGLIERELFAATLRAEHYCRRALMTQTLRAAFMGDTRMEDYRPLYGPAAQVLVLPRPPIQSVARLLSADGSEIDPASWNAQWGIVRSQVPFGQAVSAEYTAGYGDSPDAVPEMIREGILEYAARLYESRTGEREEKHAASAGRTLPPGVIDLWRPFQVELSG